MRRPRGPAELAIALVACALAVGGVVAALLVGMNRSERTAQAPTTGPLAPITVTRPNVPVIGGGIPVDIDPMVHRNDLSTTLAVLPGTHRYRITIWPAVWIMLRIWLL